MKVCIKLDAENAIVERHIPKNEGKRDGTIALVNGNPATEISEGTDVITAD